MDLGIDGKVALVTAASKGLGRGVAAALASEGCRVGICARTVSMGVGSPFAIAMKMGWFEQEGLPGQRWARGRA